MFIYSVLISLVVGVPKIAPWSELKVQVVLMCCHNGVSRAVLAIRSSSSSLTP